MLNFFAFLYYYSENRLEINITPYEENFYYLTYRDKIYNLKAPGYILKFFFYHKEIMGWTSGFPEITETWNAH